MLKGFIRKYFQSFTYFYRRLGIRIFVNVALNILVGILDGFGLAMFIPLLQIADEAGKPEKTDLGNLDFLVNGMKSLGLDINLVNILMVLVVFFILKGVVSFLSGIYNVILRQFFVKNTRLSLVDALSSISYKAYVLSDVGRIQNTMTGEVGNVIQSYQMYFAAMQQIIMVCVYMTFAFFVNPQFALLICVGGLLTNIVFNRVYVITKRTSSKLTTRTNLFQGLIIQFSSNFKYLKATGALEKYKQKLTQAIDGIDRDFKKIGSLGVFVSAIREPVLIIVVCTVILLQVNVFGGSFSAILVSLLFFYRALNSLMQMQTAYNGFLAVSGSLENLSSFERELKRDKEAVGKQNFNTFEKCISLSGAVFNYTKAKPVINNINLTVHKNETIAFIGESGSGKTTIVNLLVGLLPLSKGQMHIDGINRKDLLISTFQKRIGYITQDPVIFNDTIFNNISFWDEPTPANIEKFKQATKLASISGYVEGLPEKEQTVLGNNGVNLSGGQKQRISIARELYKDVDILVLDEATSALDSETEKAIQQSIDGLSGRYTILIVAHRLSTVLNASRIIIMDRGEIIDQGTFNELARRSGRFKTMLDLQSISASTL